MKKTTMKLIAKYKVRRIICDVISAMNHFQWNWFYYKKRRSLPITSSSRAFIIKYLQIQIDSINLFSIIPPHHKSIVMWGQNEGKVCEWRHEKSDNDITKFLGKLKIFQYKNEIFLWLFLQKFLNTASINAKLNCLWRPILASIELWNSIHVEASFCARFSWIEINLSLW